MKKKSVFRGIVALALSVSMVLTSVAVPVKAEDSKSLYFEQVSNSIVASAIAQGSAKVVESEEQYEATDTVRVSVVLDEASVIDAGYSTEDILSNSKALKYLTTVKNNQKKVEKQIEKVATNGFNVKYNLAIATNIIAAEVQYSDVEKIANVKGVKQVVIETQYFPQAASKTTDAAAPMTANTSANMTGAQQVWKAGYTGAGARIAIIDTGLDIYHQSFDNDAFIYSLEQGSPSKYLTKLYIKSLFLLDKTTINKALKYLNAYEQMEGNLTADELFYTDKIPFTFNYVDGNTTVTHVDDTQGEHGSHVAGIAAANRYLKDNSGKKVKYVSAADTVGVVGNAPDAQVIVMKVFGQNGGAYDSDYMAAIEDAIVLGCDSINLSLGSGQAGFTTNKTYQEILNKLTKSDSVVVMSAGNSGAWAENTTYGELYLDGMNFDTAGSPGSYTNSLSVASVNNTAIYSSTYFSVGKLDFSYAESTDYGNVALKTLAGTQEYVFLEGVGVEEDYKGIDVTGKIVFVSRGTTSFYQKANIAASKGAIATIIYNNQSGTIGLNLTGYEYTAPCVSITQKDAATIKASSKSQNDGQYYTGTLTIQTEAKFIKFSDTCYTMSSFSSWGVPGSLTLKPEIAAPGGYIYSVNGTNNEGGGTDQYELMSGTSMAAPQVTGMMAVLKRYIEKNLISVRGLVGLRLNNRAVAQSLLMSTAEPMKDENGNYYSILQQGAGLANIEKAINAKSIIAMSDSATASAADGKVKAELGDDPSRTGVYSVTFTITNISTKTVKYSLGADVFTQATDGDFLYGETMSLPSSTEFRVNGKKATSISVKAGQTAVVTAKISLKKDTKAFLNAYYTAGAYVEAYINVTPNDKSSAHSIPVLAYYGSWTDSSMYDIGSYIEYYYGLETRAPYLYELNSIYGNAFTVSTDGDEYYFGGNLYAKESEYHPEFASLNNQNGDKIKSIYYSLIRNAAAVVAQVVNSETGEVYYSQDLGSQYAAYYYVNGGKWRNTQSKVGLNWAGTDAEGNALPEGTKVDINLIAIPEYYVDSEGNYDISKLGDGAYFSTSLTIDNTAPELQTMQNDDWGYIAVSGKDNLGIAAAYLLDSDYNVVNSFAVNSDELLEILAVGLEDGIYYVALVDYAGNMSTYRVFLNIDVTTNVESVSLDSDKLLLVKNNSTTLTATVNPANILDESVIWTSSDETVATVNQNGVVTAVGVGECVITATSVLDETQSAECEVTVIEINYDLNGVVWDEEGKVWLSKINTASAPEYEKIAELDADINGIVTSLDGTIYATDLDTSEGVSNLYTLDAETNELTLVGTSSIGYTEIADAPALGCLMATYFNYLVLVDPETGDYMGAFNYLSSGEMVGITYIGSTYNKNYGTYLDMFYLLDSDGNLYFEAFIEIGGKYYYFNGAEEALMGSTGITCDTPYFQSMYFNGEYTFISSFNEAENSVTLYAVDTENSGSVFVLGTYADGVWPVAALCELGTSEATTNKAESLANAQVAGELQ